MEELRGLTFDIQNFSVHDGPGCRTTCFMSGCFLQCEWCANPESWNKANQMMYASVKCKHDKGCTRCENACSRNAIHTTADNQVVVDWDACRSCTSLECTETCYYGALKKIGKWYNISDLMKIFSRDRQFWGAKGGVTFSGGEPFYQKDFLLAALKACKESYIHTAIETTAFVNPDTFLDAMPLINFAFIDIKHMDTQKHKEKTGVNNERILENIKLLGQSNWKGRLVLRMPVIAGYNDTEENIIATAEFMKKNGLYEINILPFHRMGDSKWKQLGKEYVYCQDESTPMDKLEHIQEMFLDRRIACYIGSDTNF